MTASAAQPEFRWPQGLRYGLMALPLAFVALPLYVFLPNYYARSFGLPLASLGVLLLVARVADAVIDPLLGRWVDRLFARSQTQVLRFLPLPQSCWGLVLSLCFSRRCASMVRCWFGRLALCWSAIWAIAR